jgi:PAS domain S-box-containing protein
MDGGAMSEKPQPMDGNGELSHEQYFDALGVWVVVYDRELKVAHRNALFNDTFGDPGDRHCFEVLKGRKEKCPDCPVDAVFETGESQRSESVVVKPDGEEVPVMVFTSPIRDASGEVVRVVELPADISDVKKRQRKLARTQQRLRQFFDEVPCYVSVQDRDLNLVATNRRFKRDFGRERGHCYEVYKHRTEPCLECSVERTFEDGRSHESEEMVTSMAGNQYNVLVHTAAIRDEKGEITHVVEMSTNITPLRKLQTQLEATGLLIGSISHSIKGLLTGLDGGMYLVNSGLNKDNKPRIEQGWEMVTRNVDRIRSTVMNILYYAKEREPDWSEISVADLSDEVYTLTQSRAREHGVEFIKKIDESAGKVEGDHTALQSLLVNLLENSMDACRVDQKKTDHRVTLSAKGDDKTIQFDVTDSGIGMDKETRQKVFSLFFSSKGTEGTGLGLFIANSIVKQHCGTIKVESEIGRGSHFTVKIPRKRPVGQV